MTKTLYAATSKYVEEINNLPVKRQVSVSGILKKLDVSRSGYNAWKKRVPSDTSIRQTVLKEKSKKFMMIHIKTMVLLKLQLNYENLEKILLKNSRKLHASNGNKSPMDQAIYSNNH